MARLAHSSLKTLRKLSLGVIIAGKSQTPYADILEELALLSRSNFLETLTISLLIEVNSSVSVDPTDWNTLDVTLSNGFPCLRELNIEILSLVVYSGRVGALVEQIEEQIEGLLKSEESFPWSKKNLFFQSAVKVDIL